MFPVWLFVSYFCILLTFSVAYKKPLYYLSNSWTIHPGNSCDSFRVGINDLKYSQQEVLRNFFEAKCSTVLECGNLLSVILRNQVGLCFWFSADLSDVLVPPHSPALLLPLYLPIPLPSSEHCISLPTNHRTPEAEHVDPREIQINEINW